jgi:hypothetical protein
MKIDFETLFNEVTPSETDIAKGDAQLHSTALLILIGLAKRDGVSHYDLLENAFLVNKGKTPPEAVESDLENQEGPRRALFVEQGADPEKVVTDAEVAEYDLEPTEDEDDSESV